MSRNKLLAWVSVAGMLTVITVASALYLPQISFAQAEGETTTEQTTALPRGFGQDGNDEALAEALGITVEELASARTEAAVAAIDDAVAADLLTQTQADTLKERLESSDFAGRPGGMLGGMRGLGWMTTDMDFDMGWLGGFMMGGLGDGGFGPCGHGEQGYGGRGEGMPGRGGMNWNGNSGRAPDAATPNG